MKCHSPGGIPATEGEFPLGVALVNLDLTGACAVIDTFMGLGRALVCTWMAADHYPALASPPVAE